MQCTDLEVASTTLGARFFPEMRYRMPQEWQNCYVQIYAMYFETEEPDADDCLLQQIWFLVNNIDICVDYTSFDDVAAASLTMNNVLSSLPFVIDGCQPDSETILCVSADYKIRWTVHWSFVDQQPSTSITVESTGPYDNYNNTDCYSIMLIELDDVEALQYMEALQSVPYEMLDNQTLKIRKEDVGEDANHLRLIGIRRVITINERHP